MSKSKTFLGSKNTAGLIKTMYNRHKKDGGVFTLSTFTEQIPMLMANWKRIHLLDSYESLLFDPVSEMEYINNEFIQTYWSMFSVGDDYKQIKKLATPADYHNMDIGTVPDVTTSDSVYRFNNTIPLYQRLPDRHYDRSDWGSGLHGRSIETEQYQTGDMDELLAHTNKPYRKIDTDDVPYYGQPPQDSSDLLMSTMWKSD